jgi:predicted Rossmann-fold nucleotide-binding protein
MGSLLLECPTFAPDGAAQVLPLWQRGVARCATFGQRLPIAQGHAHRLAAGGTFHPNPEALPHAPHPVCHRHFLRIERGRREAYKDAAAALGSALARRGITVVYGGTHKGLMGILADAALAGGGRVHGVITQRLHDKGTCIRP